MNLNFVIFFTFFYFKYFLILIGSLHDTDIQIVIVTLEYQDKNLQIVCIIHPEVMKKAHCHAMQTCMHNYYIMYLSKIILIQQHYTMARRRSRVHFLITVEVPFCTIFFWIVLLRNVPIKEVNGAWNYKLLAEQRTLFNRNECTYDNLRTNIPVWFPSEIKG